MVRHRRRVLTAAAVVVGLSTVPGVAAHAAPRTPQPDADCSLNLVDALTRLPDDKTTLVCVDQGGGSYRWVTYDSPYPMSDRWFSYGPELRLRGQGLRNPEMMSGRWTGYPQDPDGRCGAEQIEVLRAGEVGPAQTVTGRPGEPTEITVSPTMYSIELTGHCLWQQAG